MAIGAVAKKNRNDEEKRRIAALDLKIWFEGQAHSAHGIFSFIRLAIQKFTNHIIRMNILNINLRLHI